MVMSVSRVAYHTLLRGACICFLAGFSLLTSSSVANASASANAGAACVRTTHCYGIARWYSGTMTDSSSFDGAYTSISTVPLYTNNNGTHIFTHEMWLDEVSPRCNANPNHRCWIEVGYGNFRAWYGGQFYVGMYYFWADTRPGESALHVHMLGPVQSNQFGRVQSYSIRRVNGTVYQVVAGNYVAYSTQNTMVGNTLTVGEELANQGGVPLTSAQPAFFTHTAWLDLYGWHFFQTPGNVVAMNPQATWWANPLAAGGRAFYTSCCTRGSAS